MSSQLLGAPGLGSPACVSHPRVPAAPLLATVATSGAVTPISADLVDLKSSHAHNPQNPPPRDSKQVAVAALVLFAASAHRAGSKPAANSASATIQWSHLTVEHMGAIAATRETTSDPEIATEFTDGSTWPALHPFLGSI